MMGKMSFEALELAGSFLIHSFSSEDHRGFFAKTFEKEIYRKAGVAFSVSETFVSGSAQNVIRGMHFQTNHPQAKLVSVVNGKALDVIVDLRPDSATFKNWLAVELDEKKHDSLYVPAGFAHGFLSMADNTIMLYQCDGAYDKETDTGIRYNDPEIGIRWPVGPDEVIISERDAALPLFSHFFR